MIYLGNIIKDSFYAWELAGLFKYRTLADGFTFFKFNVNYNKYHDEFNPKFELSLLICNYMIFEFEVYNVNQVNRVNK